MAAEEFAALRQQREAQRQGTADCRHAPLLVVCAAAEVPDIRGDLILRRQAAFDSDSASRCADAQPSTGSEAGEARRGCCAFTNDPVGSPSG